MNIHGGQALLKILFTLCKFNYREQIIGLKSEVVDKWINALLTVSLGGKTLDKAKLSNGKTAVQRFRNLGLKFFSLGFLVVGFSVIYKTLYTLVTPYFK
jgi:hypothetical protein